MLLLLKNHKIKRKDDDKVTQKDLEDSNYIMIDTSIELSKSSKNYVIVDPKKIPKFTKAKIRYQMIFMYDDHDEGTANFEPIPPVETETESIADVINLLNCIDRIYITNQMICNDQYLYTSVYIIIGYFEVILYNRKKKIYHKLYQNIEIDDDKKLQKYYGKGFQFPLKVVKKFRDIYNTDIIHEMVAKNEFLYIYKDMTWKIRGISNDSDYSLIGVPLLGSRTMTLLSHTEYKRIKRITRMSITYSIVFIMNEAHQNKISKQISLGDYDEIGETNHDYILISQLEYGGSFSVPYSFIYLDIMSHINFSIRLTNIIYYYVEGFESDMIDDSDGVDSIVCMYINDLFRKRGMRTLFMNEDTLIPLDELLEII